MNFPDEDIQAIINGIWEKTISLFGLGKSKPILRLYHAISSHIAKGVDIGYKVDTAFDVPDKAMLTQLRKNGYLFSGAKTFHYVLSTKNLMVDEKGKLIPKKEFFKLAGENFNLYNKTWLDTEYETAIARAQSARNEIQLLKNRKILPYATWVTSHLETVCPICAPMNGVCLPVEHEFWSTHPIPAHYKCHCIKQASEHPGYEMTTEEINKLPIFPEGFRSIALTGQLFDKTQPYFHIPGTDNAALRKQYIILAKENFGLPLPDEFKKIPNKK